MEYFSNFTSLPLGNGIFRFPSLLPYRIFFVHAIFSPDKSKNDEEEKMVTTLPHETMKGKSIFE